MEQGNRGVPVETTSPPLPRPAPPTLLPFLINEEIATALIFRFTRHETTLTLMSRQSQHPRSETERGKANIRWRMSVHTTARGGFRRQTPNRLPQNRKPNKPQNRKPNKPQATTTITCLDNADDDAKEAEGGGKDQNDQDLDKERRHLGVCQGAARPCDADADPANASA